MNDKAHHLEFPSRASRATASVRRPGFGLWLWWGFATAAASIISWALTTASGYFTMGLSLILGGSIAGVFVGGAQTFVLLRYSENLVSREQAIDWEQPLDLKWYWGRLDWVAYTILGGTVAFLMAIILQLIALSFGSALWRATIGPAIIFSMAGAVYGSFQWVVLRQVSQKAAWWVPANAVGWGMGVPFGRGVADRLLDIAMPGYETGIVMWSGDFLWAFAAGSVSTTMVSVITGGVLKWILQNYSLSQSPEYQKRS